MARYLALGRHLLYLGETFSPDFWRKIKIDLGIIELCCLIFKNYRLSRTDSNAHNSIFVAVL